MINSMSNWYNVSILEALFKKYLLAEKVSPLTLKNYLSDLRHFLGWLIITIKIDKFNTSEFINVFTFHNIQTYKDYLLAKDTPIITVNRRLSTLRKFCSFCINQAWIKENPAKKINNVKNLTSVHNIVKSVKNNNSELKINVHELSEKNVTSYKLQVASLINPYFSFIFLFLFLSFLSFGLYKQLFIKSKQPLAFTSPSTQNSRTLVFSGRLVDQLGNPLIDKTDLVFRLYNALERGSILYTGSCTGVNSIVPNVNGSVQAIIGEDCGMERIPSSVFADNNDLFLGITVGTDTEMKPRQQIANIGYTADSEKIQGLSPGADVSMIPYINNVGDLLIAASTPGIRATNQSANFMLSSANIISIQSAGMGDVILAATGSGTLKFQTGPSIKMQISNEGNVGIGNLYEPKAKLDVVAEASTNSLRLFTKGYTAGENVQLAVFQAPGLTSADGINVAELRADTNGLNNEGSFLFLNPTNNTGSGFSTGITLKSGGNIGISTTNPISLFDVNRKLNVLSGGNVGIGTTNPGYLFTVGNNLFGVNSSGSTLLPGGSAGSPSITFTSDTNTGLWSRTDNELNFSTDGTERIRIASSGTVGIGVTDPFSKLQVDAAIVGKALVTLNETGDQNILSASSSGTTKVVISHSGYLGLGTDSPSYQLQLSSDSAAKPTSNTWTIVSDQRLKEHILPFSDGLDIINKINPVSYVLNGKGSMPKGSPGIGIVAQEVKDIIPYTIATFSAKLNPEDEKETEFYSFNSSALTFVLINAIKEIDHKIEDLQKNITTTTADVINLTTETLDAIIINVQNLTAQTLDVFDATIANLTVEKKIVSPIIEVHDFIATGTAQIQKIETEEIRPKKDDLIISLDTTTATSEVKGKLSELIIKGINGKTVTTIDEEGNIKTEGNLSARNATVSATLIASELEVTNATVSSTLYANNLQSQTLDAKEASISGKITAKEIDSENLKNLENKLDTTALNTASQSADINEIQKVLAQIKKEPLPDPKYYQNITDDIPISSSESFIAQAPESKPSNSSTTRLPTPEAVGNGGQVEQLIVTGNSNLYNVTVANSLTIGNLVFQDNSLLSLAWELKLSALSTINLFDGDVIIDRGGSITTKGALIAQAGVKTDSIEALEPDHNLSIKLGSDQAKLKITNKNNEEIVSIDANGRVKFYDLEVQNLSVDKYLEATRSSVIIAAADNYKKNAIYAPAIEVGTKTAGIGVIPSDVQEVLIYNDEVSENSLIYITPTSNTNGSSLYVAEKNTCSSDNIDSNCKKYFKVAIEEAINKDINFNWLVIN